MAWRLCACDTSTSSARGRIRLRRTPGVLAKFITQMLSGEQPTIFGDGKQSRDFTYVENVVSESAGLPG